MTLKIASDLYSKPGLNAIGGARWCFRTIELATTDLVSTQLVALSILPAGHRLMDAFVDTDKLDNGGTAAAITMSVGILNTYYGEAEASATNAAAYSSGGATDTGTAPALVSGQNIMTSVTAAQAGGRAVAGLSGANMSLSPSNAIGVDKTKDRIVAVQFPVAPNTALAGTLSLAILIDRDQE